MKILALIAVLTNPLMSCATSSIDKAKGWELKQQAPALMVHYSVVDKFSLARGSSLLDVVKDVVEASQGKKSALDKAAEKSLARLKPLFSHYNLALYFDEKAAKKVEEINDVPMQQRTNNVATGSGKSAFLSDGDWIHPETVEVPFHLRTALWDNFTKKYYQQIAAKTLGGDKKKLAVSMGMELAPDSAWLFGWVCVATFRARVLDSAGKEVLLVTGTGESSARFFGGKDRYLVEACPEAAEDALATLSKVKVGTI